jgi:transposase
MTRNFTCTDAKRRAVELTMQGVHQREIAARLGTSCRTIEGWMRRPAVRAELERRRRAVLEAPLAPPSPAQRAALEAEAQAEAGVWVARRLAHYRAWRHREMVQQEPQDVA